MRPVLSAALLLCAAPAVAQEFPYQARVAADGLPVHAGPLADDYVTGTLPRGAAVTVVRHDPDGRAMVRAPAGAISFAKLDWLTMTRGTAEAGGAATVTAAGSELYCRVGSRVGEAPMIEQVPLKPGQAVTVQGVVTLPGDRGPETWAQIPSPPGEHRWVQRRYLVPANAAARADQDRDPYAVPTDLLEAAAPPPGAGPGGSVQTAAADGFAPAPADATGSGVVEIAFAAPRPLPGSGAAPLLTDDPASDVGGGPVQVAAADPFGSFGDPPALPVAGGSSAGNGWGLDGGHPQDGPPDPTLADRFADRGAAAVAADRRRLEELDGRLDTLLDADPREWDLDELAADLRDLRDRAGSKSVRRLASARLMRVEALTSIREKYADYVSLTAATDRRDAVLTAEAAETLKRFAEVAPMYEAFESPQTAGGIPVLAPSPRTAAGPGGYGDFGTYGDAPPLAAPSGIDRMSHSVPAEPTQSQPAPPSGAVAFEAVGVLRAVSNPPHPQAPRFALVGADGTVAAYLRDDPRLGLAGRVGQSFGVNGRRFKHPQIPAPMIAVQRMVPVRP